MGRHIGGDDRTQSVLFPERLDDWVDENNPVRVVDVFVDALEARADTLGYHRQVILAGPRINDGAGKFIPEQTVKSLTRSGVAVKGAEVIVLGLTFK